MCFLLWDSGTGHLPKPMTPSICTSSYISTLWLNWYIIHDETGHPGVPRVILRLLTYLLCKNASTFITSAVCGCKLHAHLSLEGYLKIQDFRLSWIFRVENLVKISPELQIRTHVFYALGCCCLPRCSPGLKIEGEQRTYTTYNISKAQPKRLRNKKVILIFPLSFFNEVHGRI